jgi:hypothetical protein
MSLCRYCQKEVDFDEGRLMSCRGSGWNTHVKCQPFWHKVLLKIGRWMEEKGKRVSDRIVNLDK